jgi:5'-3' exonuclease
MANTLLIDFSNFVNVCWWPAVAAQEADAQYDAKQVLKTNLEHKMSTMDAAMDGLHRYRIVFVEDRPAIYKLALYPLYKSNRPPKDFDPRPLAKKYMKGRGEFVWSPDNEADDAIAALASVLEGDVTIVSSDRDLWQLASPRVSFWNPATGNFAGAKDLEKAFGTPDPSFIPLIKAIWGDAGDAVPNAIPRMQKQLLPLILRSDGTLEGFAYHLRENYDTLTPRCRELISSGKEQVAINYKLVKLDPLVPLEWENEKAKDTSIG